MNLNEWETNIKQRDDISPYLIHFTKTVNSLIGELNETYILSKILSDGLLNGSTTENGFIHGDRPAVCLHDIPIPFIVKLMNKKCIELQHNRINNFTGVGLCFSKRFIYEKGGRPVIYDKPYIAKQYLDKGEWWRIVHLDLSNDKNIIDWTHEREWRVPNNLEFKLSDVIIVVPNYETYEYLSYLCKSKK